MIKPQTRVISLEQSTYEDGMGKYTAVAQGEIVMGF